MVKKKTAKLTLIVSGVALFLLAYISMLCSINAKYPQNKRILHRYGESFSYQGAEVKITNAEFLEKDKIIHNKEIMTALDNPDKSSSEDIKMALVSVDLFNPGKQTIKIDLTAFHLESNDFSLQFYYPLMIYYNHCGMYAELNSGQHVILKLPVPLFKEYFVDSNWDNIKNREYYLVSSLYPEKNMAEITFR